MEDWQLEHINENLTTLIQDIKCSTLFLAILQSNQILSKADVEQLKVCGRNDGKIDQSDLLLNILFTRTCGYEMLANALYETNQSGAFKLLLQGFEIYGVDKPFMRCRISFNMEQILALIVEFQGLKCTLQQICTYIPANELDEIIQSTLNAKSYSNLMFSTLELVQDTVPAPLPYYIIRSLSIQNRIDPILFTNLHEDVFLIQNIELSQLTKLALISSHDKDNQNACLTDVSRNQVKAVTCRFIRLEAEQHYHEIAKIATTPVHWCRFKDGKYYLITSNKGFQVCGKYITDEEEILTEAELIQSIVRPNAPAVYCISDSPGMGKSVLLANIARNIKANFPERIILFINLPQFIKECRDKDALNYKKIKNVLVSYASSNAFGQAVISKLLLSTFHPTELLFDGFDELTTELMNTAKIVLKTIVEETVCARVYVTTRPHMREILQQTLLTYAHNIQPLKKEDQIDFLVKYWQNNGGTSKDYLQKLAQVCLSNLTVCDYEREITGIPLICRMVAEVHMSEVKICSSGQDNCISEIIISDPVQSIFQMYQRHVNNCFNLVEESEREAVVSFHMHQAMKIIFPDFVDTETDQICDNLVFRIGLLEKCLAEPYHRFVHRTFAEYLVANCLAECIKNYDYFHNQSWILAGNVTYLIFKTVLESEPEPLSKYIYAGEEWKFSNPVVVYFFNEHLKAQGTILWSKNFYRVFTSGIFLNRPRRFRNKLLCALYLDCYEIFIFLKELYLSSHVIEELDSVCLQWEQLIQVAAHRSSVKLFRECCEFMETILGKRVPDMQWKSHSPLHLSIISGKYQMFEYLVKIYKGKLHNNKSLLHSCVRDSYKDPEHIISNKIQILKTLVALRKSYLEERSYGRTPLHESSIHYKLLECLILEGADLSVVNGDESNIAHLATSYLNAEEYHNLVLLLIAKDKAHLLTSKNDNNITPVRNMVEKLDVRVETLELISQVSTLILNNQDSNGDTELMAAIAGGRGMKILELMIELGGDWKLRNKREETALHVAGRNDNEQATRLLLSLGANPNDTDKYQHAPLHFVARYACENACVIAKLLLEKGAGVNAVDKQNRTPLYFANDRARKPPKDPDLENLLKEYGGISPFN